jgi:hypothetical protein
MVAQDKNQFVPVQDLAGNFVTPEPMPIKKRGRPSKKSKENITMVINEIKKRGRPKKYATAEEARKAKIANTIAGAKKRKGKGLLEDLKNREVKGKPTAVVIMEKRREAREKQIEANNANPMCSPRPTQKGGRKTIGIGVGSSRVVPVEELRRQLNRVAPIEIIQDTRDEDEVQIRNLIADYNSSKQSTESKIKKIEKQLKREESVMFKNDRDWESIYKLRKDIRDLNRALDRKLATINMEKRFFKSKYGVEVGAGLKIGGALVDRVNRSFEVAQSRWARSPHLPEDKDNEDKIFNELWGELTQIIFDDVGELTPEEEDARDELSDYFDWVANLLVPQEEEGGMVGGALIDRMNHALEVAQARWARSNHSAQDILNEHNIFEELYRGLMRSGHPDEINNDALLAIANYFVWIQGLIPLQQGGKIKGKKIFGGASVNQIGTASSLRNWVKVAGDKSKFNDIVHSADPPSDRPNRYSDIAMSFDPEAQDTIQQALIKPQNRTALEARNILINNKLKPSKKVEVKKEVVVEEGAGIVDTITAVFKGRNDYSPKVRKIISQFGNKNITSITLCRTPLGKPLLLALQVASGNTFLQKLDNTPYDKLFHLFICIEFADGSKILLEKNEVINAIIGCKIPSGTETKVISNVSTITLNDALDKTKEQMRGSFFTYSAKDNNCQDFIVAFLKANNIGDEKDISWVKQETKVLFDGNDRLRKIANTFTDIGAKIDIIRQGAGLKSPVNKKGGMIEADIEPDTPAYRKINLLREQIQDYRAENRGIERRTGNTDTPRQIRNNELIKEIEDKIAVLEKISPKTSVIDYLKKREIGKGIKKKSPVNNIRMANSWITYVKAYAKKHNMKYNEALKDPKMKEGYKKGGSMDANDEFLKDIANIENPFKDVSQTSKVQCPYCETQVAKKSLNRHIASKHGTDMPVVMERERPNSMRGLKKKKGGNVFDQLKAGLEKVGEPFKAMTGINPATLGYDLGHDYIGPALLGKGVNSSKDTFIAQLYNQANLGSNGRVNLN